MFESALSPVRLGNHSLSSRIVFGAHTNNMAVAGEPGDRQIEYLRRRNQAAMIVVEPLPVHPTTVFARGNIDRKKMERSSSRLKKLADAVTENGSVGILQLIHLGQHGDGDVSFLPNWSPSGLPSFIGSSGSHPMTNEEIKEVITSFVKSAQLAKAAGFHGIELFANYQGLIEQFWSPWFNRRTDQWGGDTSGRLKFSAEILRQIKQSCGEDFITGISVSYLDMPDVTLSLDELIEIVCWHDENNLIDYVSCGTGGYLDTSQLVPPAHQGSKLGLPLAASLKQKKLRALVQAESGFRSPQDVEETIRSGQADLVSLVRAQIAEPDYVEKLRQNQPDSIRPCLGCNQKCIGRRSRDRWISCVVNPGAGREFQLKNRRTADRRIARKVAVIGGGPAGLVLAGQLGKRGAEVELFERSSQIGGLPMLYGKSRFQSSWLAYTKWLLEFAEQPSVEIRLETEVSSNFISQIDADAVIWTTGAGQYGPLLQRTRPSLPQINPSPDAMDVVTALRNPNLVGQRVLFVDDHHGWPGLPSALQIAENGSAVTLVTGQPLVGRDLAALGVLGAMRKSFASHGGIELTDTLLVDWMHKMAKLENSVSGEMIEMPFDTLIWSTVPIGFPTEFPNPNGLGNRVHIVGDAFAPRDASSAIYDAYELAETLWN